MLYYARTENKRRLKATIWKIIYVWVFYSDSMPVRKWKKKQQFATNIKIQ